MNTNPCKMCMPMGSISAFCGIKKCMTILHGSQGCATYIRRHMATHYNEPVDIASSSLTEEGAVFGGEKNLMKGLGNLIRLYDPDVIGVSTTCLAETIGEDTAGIVERYAEEHPELRAKIITVASAGYSGTQFEGFFRTLRALVEQTEMDAAPNGKVNIITGMISPADMRILKALTRSMGIDAIFLPDLSENLDGVHKEVYERLPMEGTSLDEIAKMAGAKCTIEISSFVDPAYSPGQYLSDTYGVPLYRTALPVGLRDTDRLAALLSDSGIGGGTIPAEIEKARGRALDAMVDSHKYNAQVRAAVFGEPDFVFSVCRLLAENGALPLIAATGSVCAGFRDRVALELAGLSDFHLAESPVILDESDFAEIEAYAKKSKVNVLIGSSDGRRIAEETGIPLVRCAFPVHDYVGGQRIRTLGYEGGLMLLDQITNAVISGVENSFRGELYKSYFSAGSPEAPRPGIGEKKEHPCFGDSGGKAARIHLPVAPRCNIKCNYCVRNYDCPNESRPGVSSGILTPRAALARYLRAKGEIAHLNVVGIAGPGDALADADRTLETLRLIRAADPDVMFCLSTNGLLLPYYIDALAEVGLTHLTVTVNATDPKIGAQIYEYVEQDGVKYAGESGAAMLLANQLAGIARAKVLGIIVKANIVMLKGVNDAHIPEAARRVKAAGCALVNIMQMIPVRGSAFEHLGSASDEEISAIRRRCEEILPQMYHCRRCRADAAGAL
ncbi:MAG: radical SAM protein, partial [Clostridiales Family XIII bacterium]|nr:radical SAM protein [Clostridiales Family XIII bacterium]